MTAESKMNSKSLEKMRNIFDLSERVAIVTGAAGGLGRIFTLSLVAFGAQVVLASRNTENLKQLEDEIRHMGGDALAIPTDITEETQVDRMVAETLKWSGKIDILVNNSGIEDRVSAEEMSLKSWENVMKINATGAFLCSQRVGRAMIVRKRGKIINISSIRGRFGRAKNFVSYSSSKGALDSMTRAFACEWGQHNIQVNGIAPSLIEVGVSAPSLKDPAFVQMLISRIPLKRWGQPNDLVGSIVFLASDASSFINGQILYVDGGFSVSG
jgi:gluconate 5-dehydrogenase